MDDLVQTWDYEDYNPFYVQNDLATSAFDVDELFHMVKTAKPQLNDCKITSDNGDGEYVFDLENKQTGKEFKAKVDKDGRQNTEKYVVIRVENQGISSL